MVSFLIDQGFTLTLLPNIREPVYIKQIDHRARLRVYTGNKIRVAVICNYANSTTKPKSSVSEVLRTDDWLERLKKRICAMTAFYQSSKRAHEANSRM